MELNGVGGGLMLAVAAALWMVYLIPNWLKRREYLATERNAVRLQQTIRVLSETADVPSIQSAPTTVRRSTVAPTRPVTHEAPMAPEAPVRRVAPRAVPVPIPSARPAVVQRSTQRLRRTRAVTSIVLLGSVIAGVVQLVLLATTGAVPATWLVLGLATIGGVGSSTLLVRLAGVARTRATVAAAPVARTVRMSAPVKSPVAAPKREWTPVQVPKPVYLGKPVVAPSTMADPAVQVAAEAERAQRPPEREVAALERRLAAMGIVDVDTAAGPPLRDLNAVLARRRAAG